ncbi:cell envelope integrity protein CreD [bacterium]|nr:cell envelope integrity protein CreD [bacterium]
MNDTKPKKAFSAGAKLFAISLLSVLLLIPIAFLFILNLDRKKNHTEAEQSIENLWGGPQMLAGPFIVVPYKTVEWVTQETYNSVQSRYIKTTAQKDVIDFLYFWPENINIKASMNAQKRKRGLHKIVVNESSIHFDGSYLPLDFTKKKIAPENILWDDSFIFIKATSLKGFTNTVSLTIDQNTTELNQAEPPVSDLTASYFKKMNKEAIYGKLSLATLELLKAKNTTFSTNFNIRSSGNLAFVPLSKRMSINLDSNWSSPSFFGDYASDYKITQTGFTANWQIIQALSTMDDDKLDNVLFKGETFSPKLGVNLIEPVDLYTTSERCLKYGFLFIFLTFTLYFLCEVIFGLRIHALQYIQVGLGLCVFYLLLLALSEHISFNLAYLTAATAITGLITGYSYFVIKVKKAVLSLGTFLVGLYGFLYVLIMAESYALLMGSVGIFALLAVIMTITRNINWYELGKN